MIWAHFFVAKTIYALRPESFCALKVAIRKVQTFWASALPPFPPFECPFSVRKLKFQDKSRLRLHWKLKNPSQDKSIFTPLYVKVDLSATFTPIQSSNLPTRGDGQVRSDQIYQYILPARCSFLGNICFSFCFYVVLAGPWKWRRIQMVGLTTSICQRAGFVTRLKTII